jgi:hypothetical protein
VTLVRPQAVVDQVAAGAAQQLVRIGLGGALPFLDPGVGGAPGALAVPVVGLQPQQLAALQVIEQVLAVALVVGVEGLEA